MTKTLDRYHEKFKLEMDGYIIYVVLCYSSTKRNERFLNIWNWGYVNASIHWMIVVYIKSRLWVGAKKN